MQRFLDYSVYLAVRILICVVQALRLETCHMLARGLATLFSRVLKVRAQVTDENLRHAFPHLNEKQRNQLAWRMWEHLFLLAAEVAHARRKIHATSWRRYLRIDDAAGMVRMLLEDRPKIVVSGHYGNFELGGYVLGLFGFPTYSVARPLDNPLLDRYLNEFRGSTGQYMLPKQGSAKQIASLLQQGATLALLGDQAAGDRGCWIEFFGRPASAHKAVALFSLTHDGPIMVNYVRRTGKPLHYEVGMTGLVDPRDAEYKLLSVPGMTQWYSDRLEEMIRVAPEQYWWLHRRWKGQPRRRPARDRAA